MRPTKPPLYPHGMSVRGVTLGRPAEPASVPERDSTGSRAVEIGSAITVAVVVAVLAILAWGIWMGVVR